MGIIIWFIIGLYAIAFLQRKWQTLQAKRSKFVNSQKELYDAVSGAGKYINYSKGESCLTVSNKRCIFLFKNKIELRDLSTGEKGLILKAIRNTEIERSDILFEVCTVFNQDTTYEDLRKIINNNKILTKEITGIVALREEEPKPSKAKAYQKLMDINSASEKELELLSGISIIHAKKIIKRREEIGGFNDINELFDYLIYLRK